MARIVDKLTKLRNKNAKAFDARTSADIAEQVKCHPTQVAKLRRENGWSRGPRGRNGTKHPLRGAPVPGPAVDLANEVTRESMLPVTLPVPPEGLRLRLTNGDNRICGTLLITSKGLNFLGPNSKRCGSREIPFGTLAVIQESGLLDAVN